MDRNFKDKRVFDIFNTLFYRYGHQNWWPIVVNGRCLYLDDYRSRERTADEIFEIMVGSILTQNTSWENAAKAVSKMKENNLMNMESIMAIKIAELASVIKGSGYFNQKSRKIVALVNFLNSVSGGIEAIRSIPLKDARNMLLSVWGIGKETADSILLYGFYFMIFVVDAYTLRIFSRIGVKTAEKGYDALQRHIIKNIDSDTLIYRDFHALLVLLGKTVCRKKPLCGICVLYFLCHFAKIYTGFAQKRT